MDCPQCLDNHETVKMKCIDSREWNLNVRWRRYLCGKCGYRESTKETMKTSAKERGNDAKDSI